MKHKIFNNYKSYLKKATANIAKLIISIIFSFIKFYLGGFAFRCLFLAIYLVYPIPMTRNLIVCSIKPLSVYDILNPARYNSWTGLDIAFNLNFAKSIEQRCQEVALYKMLNSKGIKTVTLGDLGINKDCDELRIIRAIFNNNPDDTRGFASKVKGAHYASVVVWSNRETSRYPGTSLINLIKEADSTFFSSSRN